MRIHFQDTERIQYVVSALFYVPGISRKAGQKYCQYLYNIINQLVLYQWVHVLTLKDQI